MLGATALTRIPCGRRPGPPAGERHHACLRRRVVRLAGLRAPAQHRGVVDHHAPAAARSSGAAPPGCSGTCRCQRHVEHPGPLARRSSRRPASVPPSPALFTSTSIRPIWRAAGSAHRRCSSRHVARPPPDAAGSQAPSCSWARPGAARAGRATTTCAPSARQRRAGRRPDAGARCGGHHDDLARQQPAPAGSSARARLIGLRAPGRPSTRSAMMLRWISFDPP